MNMIRGYSYYERNCARPVMSLFRDIDIEVKRFQKITGLKCLKNCGHCCEKPGIEATALEFLPLAVRLRQKKRVDHWLAKIDEVSTSAACVFYERDKNNIGKGRCLVYPFRGLVCRIFGFSALRDKYGNLRLATCSILKKNHSDKIKKAQELLDSGQQAPVITSFSMRMKNINPDLGGKLLPINQAIKAAMEKTAQISGTQYLIRR